ncbi:hypothetical protein C8R45DRAFT_953641 [Mycena sanguinolenta]|nr:hypothetical protein C8R45DRAFT_953641 [Mycena sanguinolenta]
MRVDLPTGKRPGWELDVTEEEFEPASVSESCVVLQSLRQSRDQWMYFAFPRFSGRVRGKPDIVPPPHTIQFRGRCQIEIGPHIFSETSFYEVQYLPPVPPPTPAWQPSQYSYAPHGQQNAHAASQTPATQHTTSPLLSSLSSMSSISPALINRVNGAAANNPTLANLLQLAAAGKGSPEQLQTLGLLIQSLATGESPEALSSAANLAQSSVQPYPPPAPVPPAPAPTPPKEFDLVFQYYDTSHERWILPRGPVICEKVADTRTPSLTYDIVLTIALQPSNVAQPSVGNAENPSSQVVVIRLKRPPPAIWETIWGWVGGEEKLNANRKILDDLKKQTERLYLAHRIPDNTLLTQLRNATASNYVMKPIKPGPVVTPKPKRKPAQRKPAQPVPASQSQNALPASGPTFQISKMVLATPSTSSPTTAPSSTVGQPEPKRIKVARPKPGPLLEIRCVSCQQTDVPLILGGRFCRPCVDSGKATTVYVPYKPQPSYDAQQNIPVAPVYAQQRNYAQAQAPPPNSTFINAVPPPNPPSG